MNKEKGFTMVELLISITVIAIIIVPLVGIVATQLKRDQNVADRRLALIVAHSAMENALEPSLPVSAVRDDSTTINTNNQRWVVVTDPIDGQGESEPPIGTDQLEIRIRVYKPGGGLLASLTALKGTH
jgi:prepilin-type N-terminal cleavage/methylation domain-containing protein